MMMVKICGVTSPADAGLAVRAGADAVGVVMHRASPRAVGIDRARAIVRSLPPGVVSVGVFVDRPVSAVEGVARACGFTMVQLHGRESPVEVRRTRRPVIKAFRVRDSRDVVRSLRYREALCLFDAYDPSSPGGTGKVFSWNLLRRDRVPDRFLLSGGLSPANVGRAVRSVRPFGVDVSSGVERIPGIKDPGKVFAFVRRARSAARALEGGR